MAACVLSSIVVEMSAGWKHMSENNTVQRHKTGLLAYGSL